MPMPMGFKPAKRLFRVSLLKKRERAFTGAPPPQIGSWGEFPAVIFLLLRFLVGVEMETKCATF